MFRAVFLLILVLIVRVARCYPTGLVSASCGTLIPSHGGSTQVSPAPFTITTDRSSYADGVVVTVRLQAAPTAFTGFMLQAREVGGNTPVGSFSVIGTGTRLLTCSGVTNSAMAHSSSTQKTSIQATWKAPTSGSTKPIQFSATFVRDYSTYWVQVKSPVLSSTNVASSSLPSSTLSPSTSPSGSISGADCGTTKVCFSQPPNCDPAVSTDCYFLSVMVSSSNNATFQYELSGSSQGYIAMGFSDDQRMGNDDIYICGRNQNGTVQLQHAYSTGRTQPVQLPLGNVSGLKTMMSNGVISCTFTSSNPISTQRSAAVSTAYYLMFVHGPSNNGQIQFHTQNYVSDRLIDISSPQLVGLEVFPEIIKAHGSLMLIAWMTTGSLGMIIARYLKGLAKGKQSFGKDIWFVSHVSLMALSVVATSIAFILAFSFAKDWAGGAHPVLGCLVMILSLIQPIAALFRCGPHHHWRFIFNWSHAFNALVIKTLAVAAIFTGLKLLDFSSNQWLVKVMGGFLGWEVIFFVILEVHSRCFKNDAEDVNSKVARVELMLLLLFFLGNMAFLIALLVGIGMS